MSKRIDPERESEKERTDSETRDKGQDAVKQNIKSRLPKFERKASKDNPAKKTGFLYLGKNEKSEDAFRRLSEKGGWNIKEVGHHLGPNTKSFHAGSENSDCPYCRKHEMRANKTKEKETLQTGGSEEDPTSISKVFTDVREINSLSVLENITPGRAPFMLLSYDNGEVHLTCVARLVDRTWAKVIYALYNQLKTKIPTIRIKIKGDASFKSHLKPDAVVKMVSVKDLNAYRSVFSNINGYRWKPHVTIQEGHSYEGDYKIRLSISSKSSVDFSPGIYKATLDYIKNKAFEVKIKPEDTIVKKQDEKSDVGAESASDSTGKEPESTNQEVEKNK